jgi:hypothetical protein
VVGHFGAIVIGGEPMAAGPEVRGDHAVNIARNRWAAPGVWKRFMACSRCRVRWCEFSARLFRYLGCRCSTEGIAARCATG